MILIYDKYDGFRGGGLLKAHLWCIITYTIHPGLDILGNKVII